MKAAIKITRIFAVTITVLVVLFAAGLMIPGVWQIKPFVAVSESMEPLLPDGSLIYVDMKDKDVVVGDVVTYESDTMTVTHRVVGVDTDSIRTKGDANETEDVNPVERSHIIGKYIFHIPFLGYGVYAIKGNAVWVTIVALMALNLIPETLIIVSIKE